MRPMKFWELVSSFREEPWIVREVVSRPEWQEPYLRWLRAHDQLVDRQDRDVLDAPVPETLSREVARLCSRRFAYSPLWGIVRESFPDGTAPGPLEELSALEVHDRFGGWVIEEIGEYGSMTVAPSQVEQVEPPPPPPRQPPPPPRPQPTREDLEAEMERLRQRLDANAHDHNARRSLADALIHADRPEEAIGHLLVIADFYWSEGFPTSARGYLRSAGRLDAGHPDVVARQKEWG